MERKFEFEVGDRVESTAVGLKGRFEGVVVGRKISDNSKIYYEVADVKDFWQRDERELRKVVA